MAQALIEQQLLTQAALQQTGQATFVNGLSYDDKTSALVADQQKQYLYANAVRWAEAKTFSVRLLLNHYLQPL